MDTQTELTKQQYDNNEIARTLIAHALKDITLAARLVTPVVDLRGPLGKAVVYGIEYLHGPGSFQAAAAHAVTEVPPHEGAGPDSNDDSESIV